MLDIDSHIDHCPQCEADLTPYQHVGAMPSFCLQCKFPLMLVAGKYRLQRIIGQGAVGTVYLSRHVKLNHSAERVIKVIKQELLSSPNTVQRFFREVQITADLSERNEHIIRIYDDFGEIPHLGYFYVMEYIRGTSMRQYIRNQKQPLPLPLCLEIIRQLCVALQVAHEAGVIHRDLKPDNLMLTEKGMGSLYLKVLDWGIAKPLSIVDENLTQGLVGTPHYMAPEQAMNLEVSPGTDLYAVGVILYELLAGINPFVAATGKKGKSHESMIDLIQAHLYEEPPPLLSLATHRSDLTPGIEKVIFKVLEKRPDDRYSSATEFYEALQQAVVASGVQVSPIQSGSFHSIHSTSPLLTNTPAGSISAGSIPPGSHSQLANVSSSTPPFSQQLDDDSNSHKTTLDRNHILDVTDDQQMVPDISPPEKKSKILPMLALGILALLIVAGGIFAGTTLFQSQHKTQRNTQRTQMSRTTSPKVVQRQANKPPTRGIQPVWVDAQKAKQNTIPTRQVPKRAITKRIVQRRPAPRRIKRRPLPRRRRRKRKRKARRRVSQRRSLCPKGAWRPIKIQPNITRRAEMTAEPGKVLRINRRLLCVTKKTRRISIVQEGFAPCVFGVPNRRILYVKLQTAGSIGLSGQCLQRSR